MKPVLRTIHHLSCTGGTLISKCLAAMPNIALLSEIHPYRIQPIRFNPFDCVQQLFSQNIIPANQDILSYICNNRINMAYDLSKMYNKTLIIRDHAHSDYLLREEPSGLRFKSVINSVRFDFDIKSIITVRNPLDSYVSLKQNNWDKNIANFDEYCRRYNLMIKEYEGQPIFKYEKFCEQPDNILTKMCDALSIEYSESYKQNFSKIVLTGDSGRGKSLEEINPLPKRDYPLAIIEQAQASDEYVKLCHNLGYPYFH